MTTDQITAEARRIILEAGTDIVADATLIIYANRAYADVIKKSFPNSAIASATVSFANGEGTKPSDFGTLYTDAYDSNYNVFPEASIADFTRKLANSENAIAVEAGELKVSPLSTASLTLKYFPSFETLATGNSPSIDSYLHECIIDGILWRAFRDLQDFEMSQYYKKEFRDNLKDKLETLSNYEEDAQRGGQMFNGISILGGGNNSDPNHF